MTVYVEAVLHLIILTSAVAIASYPCGHGGPKIIADKHACQIFYDCSNPTTDHSLSWLHEHARECPYPELFHNKTMKCEEHGVDCGSRNRPTSLCEYVINLCTDPLCRMCRDDFTDCVTSGKTPGNKKGKSPGTKGYNCEHTKFLQKLTCPHDKGGRRIPLDSSGCGDPNLM